MGDCKTVVGCAMVGFSGDNIDLSFGFLSWSLREECQLCGYEHAWPRFKHLWHAGLVSSHCDRISETTRKIFRIWGECDEMKTQENA